MARISSRNLVVISLILIGTALYLHCYITSAFTTMDSGTMRLQDIYKLDIFLLGIIAMSFCMYVQGAPFIYKKKQYTLLTATTLILGNAIKIIICLALLYFCLYYSIIFE